MYVPHQDYVREEPGDVDQKAASPVRTVILMRMDCSRLPNQACGTRTETKRGRARRKYLFRRACLDRNLDRVRVRVRHHG